MTEKTTLDDVVNLGRALSDATRVRIVSKLLLLEDDSGRPMREIASWFPQDPSVISRHLLHLRTAGLVSAERKGKEVLYRADSAGAGVMLPLLLDVGCIE